MLEYGKRYALDLEKDIATNKNLSPYFIEAARKGSLVVIPRKNKWWGNEYWWEEPRKSGEYTEMFTVSNETRFQKCLTLIEDKPKAQPCKSMKDIVQGNKYLLDYTLMPDYFDPEFKQMAKENYPMIAVAKKIGSTQYFYWGGTYKTVPRWKERFNTTNVGYLIPIDSPTKQPTPKKERNMQAFVDVTEKFHFGKYHGYSYEYVRCTDKSYIKWCLDNGAVSIPDSWKKTLNPPTPEKSKPHDPPKAEPKCKQIFKSPQELFRFGDFKGYNYEHIRNTWQDTLLDMIKTGEIKVEFQEEQQVSKQPPIKEAKQPQPQKQQENIMKDLTRSNKNAITTATKHTAGKTAITVVRAALKKTKAVPLFARGYLDHPLADVLIANFINIMAQKFAKDPRITEIADYAMDAAYVNVIDSFNIQEMIANFIEDPQIKNIMKQLEPTTEA